jgi:uncharacterized membrane protein
MRVAVVTDIEAPRPMVWDYLMQARSWREFMDGVTRWEVQGERSGGPGTRFAMRIQVGFIELGGIVEITEFDPPCDVAWAGVTGVDQRGRWRLRELGEGRTRVELRVVYHAPGGLAAILADRVALPIVRRHLERSLAGLKRRVEALPATPPGAVGTVAMPGGSNARIPGPPPRTHEVPRAPERAPGVGSRT